MFNHKVFATEAEVVLERLGRGEDVDAGEYTFRTSVKIETAPTTSTGSTKAYSSVPVAIRPAV
jgi:hypothetical protein